MASRITQTATITGPRQVWLMCVDRLLRWRRHQPRRLQPGDLSEYLLRDIGWSDSAGRRW